MKLSMTSWSLPACTLEEAAAISTALGIGALDLGLFYRSALDRERLLGDPAALADEVRALGVELPNYYHLFGDSLENRNLALEAHREENERDFAKVLDFCERGRHTDCVRAPRRRQRRAEPRRGARRLGRLAAASRGARGASVR